MKKHYQIKHPCRIYKLEATADKTTFNCNECKKNVKDFTGMEIVQIVEQIQTSVNSCVKVLPSQLRHFNQLISNSKKVILYSSAVAMISSSCNNSLIQNFGDEYGKVILDKESEKEKTILADEIKGKLLDAYHGEPIMFAPIRILGHEFETMTDIKGNFSFLIPENIAVTSKVQFNYIGYYKLEIEIEKIKGKHIIVNLGEGPAIGYLELKQ